MLKLKNANGVIHSFDDKPLTQGGEGAVYKQFDELGHGDIGDLAKVFHSGKSQGKAEKIEAMLSMGSPEPSYSYAWPKEMLYDCETGEFRGYVMFLKHGKKEIADICRYDSGFRTRLNWLIYVTVAKNLAQAVAGVHAKNQVIGDLNDKNVLVDAELVDAENAETTLIDTDSFHITVGNKKNTIVHRCTVGMGEFIAPEIQGMNFRETELPTFTEHTDNFSLAILIFKLLMNGLHPFNSVKLNDISYEENIKRGMSPYFIKLKKGEIAEPPYAPSADMLPQGIRDLFKRAFIDGATAPKKRPSAKEFYDELELILKDENVKTCANVDWHKFPNSASSCPWCDVDEKMNNQQGISAKRTSVSKNGSVSNSTSHIQSEDYGDVASVMSVAAGGNTLPDPIPKSKNNFAVFICSTIMLITSAVIVFGLLIQIPWLFAAFAIIVGVFAIFRLPKMDFDNSYDSDLSIPSYLTVPYRQEKQTRFALFPKWKLLIFNVLCLTVLFLLGALIALGVFLLLSNLWTFAGLTLLGVFGAMFVLEKRTLWTKNALGIAMGIAGILAILAILGFVINLLF